MRRGQGGRVEVPAVAVHGQRPCKGLFVFPRMANEDIPFHRRSMLSSYAFKRATCSALPSPGTDIRGFLHEMDEVVIVIGPQSLWSDGHLALHYTGRIAMAKIEQSERLAAVHRAECPIDGSPCSRGHKERHSRAKRGDRSERSFHDFRCSLAAAADELQQSTAKADINRRLAHRGCRRLAPSNGVLYLVRPARVPACFVGPQPP